MVLLKLRRWFCAATLTVLSVASGTPYCCAQGQCNQNQNGSCEYANCNCCPPPYKHCTEGGPCICFKCGCPKPICCPANLPNWGYFQTCWRPWPWPPDWTHCYGTPPASQLIPPLSNAYGAYGTPVPGVVPPQPGTMPGDPSQLPTPRIMPPTVRPGF
jgi:hypothetical protein